MPRKQGGKNRNYPSVTLEQTLEIPRAIQDGASGMPVSKLTLASLVDRSPAASQFRELLLASRAYGLTTGGVNAEQFELTALGDDITGPDEVARTAAMKKAVLNIEPFRVFFTSYNNKRVPSQAALKEFLTQNAAVPPDRVEDCIEHLVADAGLAGLLRMVKGGSQYVDLSGGLPTEAVEPADGESGENQEQGTEEATSEHEAPRQEGSPPVVERPQPERPSKVFIAHGKNRAPLDELKKMLDQFKVPYAVAVDEPHSGRPISAKVAGLMRNECSSGIFIFTADEVFQKESAGDEPVQVWRPSENVVFELGAASVLYDRRIVIFKEKGVDFPSDFRDLGYIEFEPGQLAEKMGSLFSELVALDILEVRAKG
jgi:predicted nucleotide-binding protein